MALDGARNVLGEVGIDDCRRVFRKQCDALRNRAANRLGSMKNGDGPSVILDDDFRTGAHAGQQGRNACCGGFRFRDSDYVLAHKTIIRLAPGRCKLVESVVFTEGKLPVCPLSPVPSPVPLCTKQNRKG